MGVVHSQTAVFKILIELCLNPVGKQKCQQNKCCNLHFQYYLVLREARNISANYIIFSAKGVILIHSALAGMIFACKFKHKCVTKLIHNRLMTMTKDEDIVWINQVLDGNAYAFARLVEKHQDAVFSLVKRIIKRTDEAEDVTQMIFLKAYQSLGSFRGSALFSTWLSRIAYNTAISEYRKRKAEIIPADDAIMKRLTAELPDETEETQTEFMLQLLEKEVALLPADDQLLLGLYYTQKHSVEQISNIVSLSVPNVKTKLFRIRKRLLEAINHKTTQYSMS